MTDCIFCNIVSGELPSTTIYEDEHSFAFLDIFPVNKGHTLVVSKKHYADFSQTDADTLARIMQATQRVARAVYTGTGADGFNISTNNGAAAGQVIFHIHWHIIPRFSGDGLKLWPEGTYGEGEAERIGGQIRQNLFL